MSIYVCCNACRTWHIKYMQFPDTGNIFWTTETMLNSSNYACTDGMICVEMVLTSDLLVNLPQKMPLTPLPPPPTATPLPTHHTCMQTPTSMPTPTALTWNPAHDEGSLVQEGFFPQHGLLLALVITQKTWGQEELITMCTVIHMHPSFFGGGGGDKIKAMHFQQKNKTDRLCYM